MVALTCRVVHVTLTCRVVHGRTHNHDHGCHVVMVTATVRVMMVNEVHDKGRTVTRVGS